MRRNLLTTGLLACGLAVLSPALTSAGPSLVRGAEQDAVQSPAGGSGLVDEMMDHYTMPLGPYWMTPWPTGFCGALIAASVLECGQ